MHACRMPICIFPEIMCFEISYIVIATVDDRRIYNIGMVASTQKINKGEMFMRKTNMYGGCEMSVGGLLTAAVGGFVLAFMIFLLLTPAKASVKEHGGNTCMRTLSECIKELSDEDFPILLRYMAPDMVAKTESIVGGDADTHSFIEAYCAVVPEFTEVIFDYTSE